MTTYSASSLLVILASQILPEMECTFLETPLANTAMFHYYSIRRPVQATGIPDEIMFAAKSACGRRMPAAGFVHTRREGGRTPPASIRSGGALRRSAGFWMALPLHRAGGAAAAAGGFACTAVARQMYDDGRYDRQQYGADEDRRKVFQKPRPHVVSPPNRCVFAARRAVRTGPGCAAWSPRGTGGTAGIPSAPRAQWQRSDRRH